MPERRCATAHSMATSLGNAHDVGGPLDLTVQALEQRW